ncbi:MAG: aldose 1-epimerase family protein, partial [Fuerstiella sp.]|nr:aldose 1-epimerase family protein [Fuerstiella sp.]
LICRCGLGWHGAPGTDIVRDADGKVLSEQFLPLHGRIANLPAHTVTIEISDDGVLSLTGVVDEASLFGGRLRLTSKLSTRIGSSTIHISDTVQNLGASPAEVEMLYHCNIGRPFLGKGASFHVAAREVAPRDNRAAEDIETWQTYESPESGYAEQVYFLRPISDSDGYAHAVLKDSAGEHALSIRFATATLPWLALWKNTQAEEDGYCTGLEPDTSFPNLRSF